MKTSIQASILIAALVLAGFVAWRLGTHGGTAPVPPPGALVVTPLPSPVIARSVGIGKSPADFGWQGESPSPKS